MNRCLSISAITLLVLCIDVAPTSSAAEFQNDLIAGMKLSADEAEALEERLDRDPHDLQARSRLVVYYFPKSIADPLARRTHSQHVLWLIRNAPRAGVLASPHAQIQPVFDADGYNAGKSAWLRHIEREPTNATLLGNAANFLSEFEDRELQIETLQQAQSYDPGNTKWPTLLGHLFLRGAADEPLGAALALEQFQRAYEIAGHDREREYLLESLAKAAFAAERYDDASAYATAMLANPGSGRDNGNRRHHGNLILGRIALIDDDGERAKHHLLEAGRIAGSPQLSSFGPNMRLAADLLERGETEVVLEYFELCANFWPNDKLKDWAALVRGGRTPDFGANLIY